MSFLAPLFFAGLAALAIPVLIHLIQRERKNVVAFPSLMFVRRIPYSSIRRRRIHNWALLLLRLAALALIVAAFARPFLRSTSSSAAAGGARDVVILLDRSYSMGHGDQWDARAARGRRRGRRLGRRRSRDAGAVCDQRRKSPCSRPTTSARLQSEIERRARCRAGATRYGPALKLAGSLLAASNLPRREVILVSDFQRSGWSPGDGLRLPAGTTLTPVTVQAADGDEPCRDAGDDAARSGVGAGSRHGHGRRPQSQRRSRHRLAGVARTRRPRRADRARDRAAARLGSTTFPPVTLVAPNTRGAVRIGDDALARDNAFHFVLSPPRPCPSTSSAARAARATRRCISRGRWRSARARASRSPRGPSTTCSDDVLGTTAGRHPQRREPERRRRRRA